jgi:hypothetical protein
MAQATKATQTAKPSSPRDDRSPLEDFDIAKAVSDVTEQALKIPIGILEAVGEGLSGMFDSARRSTASK